METFGEYDPATPLAKTYCSRISAKEYELQGSMETYSALQELLEYMDGNTDVVRKIIAKKKQEETENEGLFSFLKCKVLEKIKGPNFMMDDISEDECQNRLQTMQGEMCDVFNYAEETKSSPVTKRFSKRLAAKRVNRGTPQRTTPKRVKGPPAPPPPPPYPPPGSSTSTTDPTLTGSVLGMAPSPRKPLRYMDNGASSKTTAKGSKTGTPSAPPMAPPPPPPPPLGNTPTIVAKPLQERTNIMSTPTGLPQSPAKKLLLKSEHRVTQLKKAGSTTSLNSISSVHDELIGFDRGKLKSVNSSSPGRTPKRKVPTKPPRPGVTVDLGVDSFNLKMLEKFKNVHSPSRYGSPNSGFESPSSPSGFTP